MVATEGVLEALRALKKALRGALSACAPNIKALSTTLRPITPFIASAAVRIMEENLR